MKATKWIIKNTSGHTRNRNSRGMTSSLEELISEKPFYNALGPRGAGHTTKQQIC